MSSYMNGNYGNRSDKLRKRKYILGYGLMVIIAVIVTLRAISVINAYNERGGFAQVQLLNYSMPVVKTQVYDEGAYVENRLSVKRVVAEALGLKNITTFGIVGSEVSIYKSAKISTGTKKLPFSIFAPYEVKEGSIAKLTQEEIDELNSTSPAYNPNLKKNLDTSKPEILIYHTHTHESYAEVGGSSEDENFSIVGVGDVLAKELEEGYGISVVHDKTIHDTSYNECYNRSGETVQKYLDQYGDFKLIIDLHRDSTDNKAAVTANVDNKDLAKIMFVTTTNSTRYEKNRQAVDSLLSIGNNLFPSIIRSTPIYEYDLGIRAFNQSLSDNSVLVEMGSYCNSAQEAKLTAKYLARMIAEYLNVQ